MVKVLCHTVTPGSSPLARGLPDQGRRCVLVVGIIPARAGFTLGRRAMSSAWGDHPRSRGVYSIHHSTVRNLSGSSPLARGLHPSRHKAERGDGIIPARAGFTRKRTGAAPTTWDHPRSRGVYAYSLSDLLAQLGSSPLARGLPRINRPLMNIAGIIPARAGFTQTIGWMPINNEDHPRSRGVYTVVAACASGASGSSPLARGLRAHAVHACVE